MKVALHRLACVALLLAAAYALALWQPVRAWYSDVDKLAHGLVFAGVYAALAWAVRWKPPALVALALALGAAVEVHQFFLPGFFASVNDWLADAVGIGLACGAHLVWRRWRETGSLHDRHVPHRRSAVFQEDCHQRAGHQGPGLVPDGPSGMPASAIQAPLLREMKGKSWPFLQDQKGDASCATKT